MSERIGEYVRGYIPRIIEYCREHPDELLSLMDGRYTRRVFRLPQRWPFCLEAKNVPEREYGKYWTRTWELSDGRTIRVCSQWTRNHWRPFRDYIRSKGLLDPLEPQSDPVLDPPVPAADDVIKARYK